MEIPRPAGEGAGLRNDAVSHGCMRGVWRDQRFGRVRVRRLVASATSGLEADATICDLDAGAFEDGGFSG
jgi:hypothetical protein